MVRLLLTGLIVSSLVGCRPQSGGDRASEASSSPVEVETVAPIVNVYSARHYDTDDEVYAAFEAATGIEVNVIDGNSAALLERLAREGEKSPADLFVTVDAGRLFQAEEAGIFEPTRSEVLEQRVPASLRHPEGLWFGVTKRARVIVVAKDRVAPGAVTRYEDLAQPKWKGKVLIRSSSNVYNQSLLGSIIAAGGEEAAEAWCRGVVDNMARTPQGGDRDQIRAVAAGEGDVAVVNSYYLAKMLAADSDEADREAAAAVQIVFPNQDDRGTHVNISGAGVVRGAPHRDNAIRLLEFLTEPESQALFAGGNKEYPVTASTETVTELAAWGDFEEDKVNAAVFGSEGQKALRIFDRCGWR